ncbi:hypothetical protein Y032_0846g2657 [Ancylostoma ceylanicum]|uniref:Uncharacterized protein n=1 Tax=Ancylostoma ceylanicum TaxID=53326 RepID=A0A016WCZ9_9BILA|nr:hypothetical protein Y032_0846g2657 [Ancylostoma ceylanicum]
MLAGHQGSRTPTKCDGDEDVTMGGGYHTCRPHPQREVPEKRPKGRPKQRWLETLHADMKHVCVHPDQTRDRAKWHQKIRKADPATKRD